MGIAFSGIISPKRFLRAIKEGELDLVTRYLIQSDADLGCHDKEGRNCLHLAAHYDRYEIAKRICTHFHSVNPEFFIKALDESDNNNASPLYIAAECSITIFQLLIAYEESKKSFSTCFDDAIRGKNTDVAALCLSSGLAPTQEQLLHLLNLAIEKNKDNIAKTIIKHPLFNPSQDDLWVCINKAVKNNSFMILSALALHPIAEIRSADLDYVVRKAIKHSDATSVYKAMQLDCFDPNYKDDTGETLLHFLLREKHVPINILKLILSSKNVDANVRNSKLDTPFMVYLESHNQYNLQIIELLLKHSDIDAVDSEGDSILHIIVRKTPYYNHMSDNIIDCIKLLVAYGIDLAKHKESALKILATFRNASRYDYGKKKCDQLIRYFESEKGHFKLFDRLALPAPDAPPDYEENKETGCYDCV